VVRTSCAQRRGLCLDAQRKSELAYRVDDRAGVGCIDDGDTCAVGGADGVAPGDGGGQGETVPVTELSDSVGVLGRADLVRDHSDALHG